MTKDAPSSPSASEPMPELGQGAIRPARDVQRMFGRIVRRYDLVNRLMTGGRDVAWRKRVARRATAGGRTQRVLDVATGTGDLAIALRREGALTVIGLDFAQPMLFAAAEKPAIRPGHGAPDLIPLTTGDAMRLPFPDDTFDACTVAFGLRNMADYEAATREMTRVLRPGGRWVCLELTPFRVPVLGRLFAFYFERVVPFVGGIISGDREAYRYLPSSVVNFPSAPDLAAMMKRAGLENARYQRLGAGTVAMHIGEKPGQA